MIVGLDSLHSAHMAPGRAWLLRCSGNSIVSVEEPLSRGDREFVSCEHYASRTQWCRPP
jgi:hypothetical protein